jgi:hypothetical protein
VLLWQVACEYLWASRKLESQAYSYSDALEDVLDLRTGLGDSVTNVERIGPDSPTQVKGFLALGRIADRDVS